MYTTTSGWQLKRVSGPEIEPVTLAEVKAHAKIDPDITGDDQTIEDVYIPAAREAVEDYTLRTLCESTWELKAREFPCGELFLPRGPVLAILGISYLQNDGTRVDITDFQQALEQSPPWLSPAVGRVWPVSRCDDGAVVVTYRAGFAGAGSPADASGVPARIKHTILAICTRYIEERKVVDVDDLLLAGVFKYRVFGP